VIPQPEDRRALGRGIAASPLKQTGSITDDVRDNVHHCLIPIYELSVVPNFFRFGDGHHSFLSVLVSSNKEIDRDTSSFIRVMSGFPGLMAIFSNFPVSRET
jgi:hypothetical protein